MRKKKMKNRLFNGGFYLRFGLFDGGRSAVFFGLGVLMAAALINTAFAGEPPSWSEFEIKSGNGSHVAEIRAKEKPEGVEPSMWAYTITVSRLEGEEKTTLWSCDYDYNGKPGGLLSNDGKTFVYVEFFYKPETPAVTIYHDGLKTGALCGKDFEIDETLLKGSEPNRLWLFEESPRYRFVRSGVLPIALEIKTIDGMAHLIDVTTGSFFGGAG